MDVEVGGMTEFMCIILQFIGIGEDMRCDDNIIKTYLPELYKRKPETAQHSWFLDFDPRKRIEARKEILKQCIEETY